MIPRRRLRSEPRRFRNRPPRRPGARPRGARSGRHARVVVTIHDILGLWRPGYFRRRLGPVKRSSLRRPLGRSRVPTSWLRRRSSAAKTSRSTCRFNPTAWWWSRIPSPRPPADFAGRCRSKPSPGLAWSSEPARASVDRPHGPSQGSRRPPRGHADAAAPRSHSHPRRAPAASLMAREGRFTEHRPLADDRLRPLHAALARGSLGLSGPGGDGYGAAGRGIRWRGHRGSGRRCRPARAVRQPRLSRQVR
ncbi:MAG: hypothetical protein KatS3mg062_1300 [Tepidiforma sp.]|nr:MAG: hypothetical protein KatS3mg062_1300 [Tepidiforma sp.]